MPIRDDAPTGAPCWLELFTSDPDAACRFYGGLFGWSFEEPDLELGGYRNARLGHVRVAGMMRSDGTGGPDGWTTYLRVDDVEKVAEVAQVEGGQVLVPPVPVADLGAFVLVADAGGHVVGGWEPGAHRGFGVVDEPGAPTWFELHTTDYRGSLAFLREVFGWEASTMADEADFRYSTLGQGECALAGVMDVVDLPRDAFPARWTPYVRVADLDVALALVPQLGGAVLQGPDDSPYGRLAAVADPTGAVLKLQQP